jgi:hypothetical protein
MKKYFKIGCLIFLFEPLMSVLLYSPSLGIGTPDTINAAGK